MFQTEGIKILGISGSLKSTSSNSAILHTMQDFQVEGVELFIYEALENIPPFHPEKEAGTDSVKEFRSLVAKADGVLISTPEYAFGVPGVLKNALDWLVSSGEMNEKPVAAISASPMYSGGDKAMASLLLTLGALGAKMEDASSFSIPNILNKMTLGKVNDLETLQGLVRILRHLVGSVKGF